MSRRYARLDSVSSLPGTTHRYVQYSQPDRCHGPLKFRATGKKATDWVHTVYRDGKLLVREVLDATDVDIALVLAQAEGHTVRGSEMPDVVNLFEVYERVSPAV